MIEPPILTCANCGKDFPDTRANRTRKPNAVRFCTKECLVSWNRRSYLRNLQSMEAKRRKA